MIRFGHTNLITDDWKKLADFYIKVFDCQPLYPERDLAGEWLDQATAIPNARLKGIHLTLPGYADNAPTLEIFQYAENVDSTPPPSNRKGFGHIAFQVDDVQEVLERLLASGGSKVGEIVTTDIADAGRITFVYARDIDGNIVEIQRWH